VGDKVMIPGGDNFSKAIINLWNQHLFSNVQIYFTKLEGNKLFIEIHVSERPALSKFNIIGVKKADQDELKNKVALVTGRVVTENTKRTAEEAIKKYYTEKGFQSAAVRIEELQDPALPNSIILNLYVEKGHKVRIDNVSFFGNDQVTGLKLKKQLKGTKEMTKVTLYADTTTGPYGITDKILFKDYLRDAGFLSLTKTKEFLDPYFRFKLFSSAKFNEKKFEEDKEKVLEYYNSLGFRDAAIVDAQKYYNQKGNLRIDIKVDEGHRYYFGNVSWKGNTKFPIQCFLKCWVLPKVIFITSIS
jgi:outer membrane protein insertion porin family